MSNRVYRTGPQLALAHLSVIDAHPMELVDAAVAGGFDSIGLRIMAPRPTDRIVPVIGNEPLIRELLAKLRHTGLGVLDVETFWIGPNIDIAALAPAFELAQRLGARNVSVMGDDPDEPRLTANFARFCELCAGFGLRASLEFAAYTHTPSLQYARRIVRAAGQSNARVLIDALHLIRSGAGPADLASLDPELLVYCQLCDARGPRPATNDGLRIEARTDRHYPGTGELPLAAILDALPTDLPIGVEAPSVQHAGLSVVERGRLCGQAARAFLHEYRQQRRVAASSSRRRGCLTGPLQMSKKTVSPSPWSRMSNR